MKITATELLADKRNTRSQLAEKVEELDACKYGGGQQAAEVLRNNGSAKVEFVHNVPTDTILFSEISRVKLIGPGVVKWTEHEEIRIVPVKSKPVFEKVEETK